MATPKSAYRESPILVGAEGLYKDVPPLLVQVGKDTRLSGWRELDQHYIYNGQLLKFGGWAGFKNQQLDGQVIWGTSFRKMSGTRFFLVGTPTSIYVYNGANFVKVSKKSGGNSVDYNTPAGFKWQAAVIGDNICLTNYNYTLQFASAPAVGAEFADIVGDGSMPKAKFMINFANRLFCAYTNEGSTAYPQRVRWADLGSATVWQPASSNEAGFKDLDDESSEITGLGLLPHDRAAIYKADQIYVATYVGGTGAFNIVRMIDGLGNAYPYSLVDYKDMHYFLGADDFYAYNGISAPRPLGIGKVKDYIISSVLADSPHAVYGFAHPTKPLLYWVFVPSTATSLIYNRALVLNVETGAWSERTYFPHSALFSHFYSGLTIADLTGTIGNLVGDIAHIGGSAGAELVFSGDRSGYIYVHEQNDNGGNVPLGGVAETGDLSYGSLQLNKRANRTQMELWTPTPSQNIKLQVLTKSSQSKPAAIGASLNLDFNTNVADYRVHGKLLSFKLTSDGVYGLTAFSTRVAIAGRQ